ncbi:concanavalin A-like lectin/glucanase domain-containing protein [Phyllosticta capitalensis]|uniref:concanavalin A-like lectin/glucanase domain-containing protein n=1 Tax=Phyllosticta capitalensis TaxID=121624 RepID=UPI0031324D85
MPLPLARETPPTRSCDVTHTIPLLRHSSHTVDQKQQTDGTTAQSNASDTGNTDIEYPTYLTMRTVRLADFSSASEMQNNQQNMMHASVRMRARVVGASGAVAGFFTYYDDDNEADIEILTQYPSNQYEYTNQPSVSKDGNEITAATVNVTMPSSDAADDWTQWHDHRIDWLPHRCNWYLDGRLVASNSYSVPRKPSGLVLNMWSNGGSWSGNMTEGDAAEFHVQWVQMVFNTSGPRGGPDAETKKMRRSARSLEEREWPEEQLGVGDGGDSSDDSDSDMQTAIWRDWDSDVEEDDADASSIWDWPAGMVDSLTSKVKRTTNPLTPVLEKRKKHKKQPGCETVCRVDGVKAVGYPEVAYVSMGGAAGLVAGHAVVWCVVAAVGALLAWS